MNSAAHNNNLEIMGAKANKSLFCTWVDMCFALHIHTQKESSYEYGVCPSHIVPYFYMYMYTFLNTCLAELAFFPLKQCALGMEVSGKSPSSRGSLFSVLPSSEEIVSRSTLLPSRL